MTIIFGSIWWQHFGLGYCEKPIRNEIVPLVLLRLHSYNRIGDCSVIAQPGCTCVRACWSLIKWMQQEPLSQSTIELFSIRDTGILFCLIAHRYRQNIENHRSDIFWHNGVWQRAAGKPDERKPHIFCRSYNSLRTVFLYVFCCCYYCQYFVKSHVSQDEECCCSRAARLFMFGWMQFFCWRSSGISRTMEERIGLTLYYALSGCMEAISHPHSWQIRWTKPALEVNWCLLIFVADYIYTRKEMWNIRITGGCFHLVLVSIGTNWRKIANVCVSMAFLVYFIIIGQKIMQE